VGISVSLSNNFEVILVWADVSGIFVVIIMLNALVNGGILT
jgi:hypothetical protein